MTELDSDETTAESPRSVVHPSSWRGVRRGWLADHFCRPVLVGYNHEVAIVLACGQLRKRLGIVSTRRRADAA